MIPVASSFNTTAQIDFQAGMVALFTPDGQTRCLTRAAYAILHRQTDP
jgi:hypothetical protein